VLLNEDYHFQFIFLISMNTVYLCTLSISLYEYRLFYLKNDETNQVKRVKRTISQKSKLLRNTLHELQLLYASTWIFIYNQTFVIKLSNSLFGTPCLNYHDQISTNNFLSSYWSMTIYHSLTTHSTLYQLKIWIKKWQNYTIRHLA